MNLRPFEDKDIALVERWLYVPHVAQWYTYPEHWLNELANRHDEFSFLTHFIVEVDGVAIGFCQYYDTFYAQEHEVWNESWRVSEISGVNFSLDYLIGETEYLGKGYGKEIIRQLTEKVKTLGAKRILVEPEPANAASGAVLEANGYRFNGVDYVFDFLS